jgi:hypothetical protein
VRGTRAERLAAAAAAVQQVMGGRAG